MSEHHNAKTTPISRQLLVDRVLRDQWSVAETAEALGISVRTVYKWLARYRAEGTAGLRNRSSRPHHSPLKTPAPKERAIEQLRRKRLLGREIARRVRMALSTVHAVLKRLGLGRLAALVRPEPARRYEWPRSGDLFHVDIKKFGRFREVGHRATGVRTHRSRGIGDEYAYVCVDDHTRVAYVEVLANEQAVTAVGFLRRAVTWFAEQGAKGRRVLTDNGSAFRSLIWAEACEELGLRAMTTRPYTPRTNGKAERFIQTLQNEWAYGKLYQTSAGRRRALPAWLRYYNEDRPHRSLAMKTPMARMLEGA
jgi:transposase InsO family protein